MQGLGFRKAFIRIMGVGDKVLGYRVQDLGFRV